MLFLSDIPARVFILLIPRPHCCGLQINLPAGGAEGDSPAGGGGSTLHRDSRGLAAERTETQQHRHAARHCPHARDADLCL